VLSVVDNLPGLVVPEGVRSAAEPRAGFENGDGTAARREIHPGRQTGESPADDGNTFHDVSTTN
jgi:hypothetical protein